MNRTGTAGRQLTRAIRAATGQKRLALAPFLTAGYPDRAGFGELLARVAVESDLVEIGVPFSDPMADGVTIQRSSHAALEQGVELGWILDTARATGSETPFVLMSYLNPLLAYGIERLAERAVDCSVHGLIVPDLPLEESDEIRGICDRSGLGLVQLVTPVTPAERLETLCRESRGFVYAVTMTGTTGGAAKEGEGMLDYLGRVRKLAELPVLAGFGIRRPEQMRKLVDATDGAIVGSALIEVLERKEDPVSFLRDLREGGAR